MKFLDLKYYYAEKLGGEESTVPLLKNLNSSFLIILFYRTNHFDLIVCDGSNIKSISQF